MILLVFTVRELPVVRRGGVSVGSLAAGLSQEAVQASPWCTHRQAGLLSW